MICKMEILIDNIKRFREKPVDDKWFDSWNVHNFLLINFNLFCGCLLLKTRTIFFNWINFAQTNDKRQEKNAP